MSKTKYSLVAGGAGFLEAHLCKKLINKGEAVLCIDNLYTGNIKNLSNLKEEKDFIFLKANINDSIEIDLPIKQIFNLACPASPRHYQKDPIFTLRTCFNGSLNLLNLAKDLNIPIFHASTSEIYGNPLEHPQKVSYWGNVNPIGVRSCYDEGKRVAETLFFDFHRSFKTDVRVARIFNTYGPYMDIEDGRVVSNFIVQALKGKPLTVYGDGSQTRSFCYVDDLVTGIILLMENRRKLNGPFNLGNPNEFSVKELAEEIIKLTNSNSEIHYSSLPEDDPTMRNPDISETISNLGWKPQIELKEGLKKTTKYFKTVL